MVKIWMKYVHTFGTGRHKRQADWTLLFEYTTFFMLNSTEHEISTTNKNLNTH